MSQSEVISALPTGANADSPILRNYLITRTVYPFADDEDPQAFEALDADTGAIPRGVAWMGIIFWLDPDDTTTAHDGVTTVVTADGYRYKYDGVDYLIRSVLDKDLTAPPGSEDFGDAYIVGAAATGDWVGQSEKLAIYTSRGWKFILPKIGQIVYVEDEDAYYHYDVAGDWVAGFGDSQLSDNTVLPANILGGRTHWTIENQTTDAPPGSPTDGVAYIIGSSPSGDWAGHAGKIAVAKNSAWIIITPGIGYEAFDKSDSTSYVYITGGWVNGGGVIVGAATVAVAGTGSTTQASSTLFDGSDTVAPTTSQRRRTDTGTEVTYAARASGKRLRFIYSAKVLLSEVLDSMSGGPNEGLVIALFRDSEVNALDWVGMPWMEVGTVSASAFSIRTGVTAILETTAPDANAHTYRIAIFAGAFSSDDGFDCGELARRRLSVEEFA